MQPESKALDASKVNTQIDTDGGAVIERDVATRGGDFIGRDQIIINVSTPSTIASVLNQVRNGGQNAVPTASPAQPATAAGCSEQQMIRIPAGEFLMGRPSGDGIPSEETDQHKVMLGDYYIARHPVTVREYARFVKETNHDHAEWNGKSAADKDQDYPVVGVSWNDARAYCEWLKKDNGCLYRLPTEAEWEKAARGTDGRLYPWPNDWDANRSDYGAEVTKPVGSYPQGKSFYHCEDMVSSRWEWTSTLWGRDWLTPAYPARYDAKDGREKSAAEHGMLRVLRGGSADSAVSPPNCTARYGYFPDRRYKRHGFRVALDATIPAPISRSPAKLVELEPFPEPKPRTLEPAARKRLIEILASQADHAPPAVGAKGYLSNRVRNTNWPADWQRQRANALTGVPDHDAQALVDWAINQGTNPDPNYERYTVLGGLVEIMLDDVGGEDREFWKA